VPLRVKALPVQQLLVYQQLQQVATPQFFSRGSRPSASRRLPLRILHYYQKSTTAIKYAMFKDFRYDRADWHATEVVNSNSFTINIAITFQKGTLYSIYSSISPSFVVAENKYNKPKLN